jgi:hypothetical protein
MAGRQQAPIALRSADVEAEIEKRGKSRGAIAARDLGRYYRLIQGQVLALPDELAGQLVEGLREAVESGRTRSYTAQEVTGLIDQILRGDLGPYTTVTPVEAMATLDAVERAVFATQEGDDMWNVLAEVGLASASASAPRGESLWVLKLLSDRVISVPVSPDYEIEATSWVATQWVGSSQPAQIITTILAKATPAGSEKLWGRLEADGFAVVDHEVAADGRYLDLNGRRTIVVRNGRIAESTSPTGAAGFRFRLARSMQMGETVDTR